MRERNDQKNEEADEKVKMTALENDKYDRAGDIEGKLGIREVKSHDYSV